MDTFKQLKFGIVDRIDMVQRENGNGEKYQRVFIHFKFWFITNYAENVKTKLVRGDDVKVVYDEPWFWKISMSKVIKPEKKTHLVSSSASHTIKSDDVSNEDIKQKNTTTTTTTSTPPQDLKINIQSIQEKEEKTKSTTMLEQLRIDLIKEKTRIEELIAKLERSRETPQTPQHFHCSPPITPSHNEAGKKTPTAPKAKSCVSNHTYTNLKPKQLCFDQFK